MGLPALMSPETWVVLPPLPAVEPSALAHLASDVRSLLDDARQNRPAEGTPAETKALVRVALFGFASLRVLGPGFIGVQRENLNRALAELLRRELDAAEPERKLALRHIEQAVHKYGVLTESMWAVLGTLPAASMPEMVDELSRHIEAEDLAMESSDRVVLRFQLDVMVALDVLDAPLDELTFWAFRAITDARRVEALPAAMTSNVLRGELARLRSRRSWLAWDVAEIAKELAPWPTPSR